MEDRLSRFSRAVDELTREILASQPQFQGLYDMARYHVGWIDESGAPFDAPAGKKLRPALVMLVAEAIGADASAAVPVATAIELIHNFSLIHDDIEDNSTLRRHRTTVWAHWGLAQGINTGDAVLILAQQAIAEHASPAYALDALRILNRACRGLCEGQYLDILWEEEASVTVEQYLEMIERKTARLFQTSAWLGALAAGADAVTQAAFGAFGSALGMAFQVADDLLDVWSPESTTGKTAALDIVTRKKALPAILGLSKTGAAADELRHLFDVTQLVSGQAKPSDRGLTPAETARAVAILDELGIRHEATAFAHRYREEALACLESLRSRFDVASLEDFVSVTLPAV